MAAIAGRGAPDMKGFVACALHAMRKAAFRPLQTPLHLALSHDAEIGCIGVHSLLEWLEIAPIRPRMCVVGEPTMLAVAAGHKGTAALHAVCMGRGGHSTMVPEALNAIHVGVGVVGALRDSQEEIGANGARDDAYEVSYTTVHVGRKTAGSALNIVPDRCDIDFVLRVISADRPDSLLERVRADLEGLVTCCGAGNVAALQKALISPG